MATYPGGLKTYTNKVDGVDTVLAADMNSVQGEIQAIETELGVNARTSALPASAGTYNSSGTNTTVTARLTNLEAGLTGDATDGTRVGYTLLASGSFTATANSDLTSISQSYSKLVLHIAITAYTSGAAFGLRFNGNLTGSYSYTRQAYGTSTPNTSTTGTEFPLGTVSAVDNSYVVEIPAYNTTTAGKPITWLGHSVSGTGYMPLGAAITSLRFVTVGGTYTYTYKLYGVK